jgi:hypothetical protein
VELDHVDRAIKENQDELGVSNLKEAISDLEDAEDDNLLSGQHQC